MNHLESTLALRRTLQHENVTLTAYSIMVACATEPIAIARLTVDLGMSYQAVCNVVDRAEWFVKCKLADLGLRAVQMNDAGRERLAKIRQRLLTEQINANPDILAFAKVFRSVQGLHSDLDKPGPFSSSAQRMRLDADTWLREFGKFLDLHPEIEGALPHA